MKLVEILARKLSEWPTGIVSMSQDNDCRVSGYSDTIQFLDGDGDWTTDGYIGLSRFKITLLADDYETAIVTREMWQAEKQRLFGNCEGTIKEVAVEGTTLYNPIQSRDRIYEIDSLVESLEEERVSLVQQLEVEGFKLVGKGVKAYPAEDMSDPSNWEVGDIIKAVSESSGYKQGYTYVVKGFDSDRGIVFTEYDSLGCSTNGWKYRHFKFHSRPKV